MGTEILGIFILLPPLFIMWNIWQLRKSETRRKSLLLIVAGLIF